MDSRPDSGSHTDLSLSPIDRLFAPGHISAYDIYPDIFNVNLSAFKPNSTDTHTKKPMHAATLVSLSDFIIEATVCI